MYARSTPLDYPSRTPRVPHEHASIALEYPFSTHSLPLRTPKMHRAPVHVCVLVRVQPWLRVARGRYSAGRDRPVEYPIRSAKVPLRAKPPHNRHHPSPPSPPHGAYHTLRVLLDMSTVGVPSKYPICTLEYAVSTVSVLDCCHPSTHPLRPGATHCRALPAASYGGCDKDPKERRMRGVVHRTV